MAILRITTGDDGQSHFEDIEPNFEPLSVGSQRIVNIASVETDH